MRDGRDLDRRRYWPIFMVDLEEYVAPGGIRVLHTCIMSVQSIVS